MNDDTRDLLENVWKPIVIYVLITVSSFIILPSADFTRTLIFLNCIIAAFYYKEEFEEVIFICFGGPAITGVMTIIITIILEIGKGADMFTLLIATFTFMMSYVLIAGVFGLLINTITTWLSGHLTAQIDKTKLSVTENVFSVMNQYSESEKPIIVEDNYKSEKDSFSIHTNRQVFGILAALVLLFGLTLSLYILPMYDYSLDLHLTVWDLGWIPIISIGIAAFCLLSLAIVTAIWRFFPDVVEKLPSLVIGIQSKLIVLSVFFASIFFPTPSTMRVESFTVQSGIGIEILIYVIALLIIVTPPIIEFFRPLTHRETDKLLTS
ncbi:MAG: hypothetical protein ACFE95_03170 [Candidatus Hodarchaeota archaeon]